MKQIKCNNCSKEWYVQNGEEKSILVCPFCSSYIRKKVTLRNSETLGETIYGIIAEYGLSRVSSKSLLIAFLSDVTQSMSEDIKKLDKFFTEKCMAHFIGAFDQSLEDAKCTIQKISFLMIKYEYCPEKDAEYFCRNFMEAIEYYKRGGYSDKVTAEITDFSPIIKEKPSVESYSFDEKRYEREEIYISACKEYENENYSAAAELYEKAYENGNVLAGAKLGEMHMLKKFDGADAEKALPYLLEAAQYGYNDAQRCVGDIYYHGSGIEKDYAEAVRWYCRSADGGNPNACFRAANIYEEGAPGVEPNAELEYKYREMAAENGSADDWYRFGLILLSDKDKYKKFHDEARGIECIEKSAQKGYYKAKKWLADN